MLIHQILKDKVIVTNGNMQFTIMKSPEFHNKLIRAVDSRTIRTLQLKNSQNKRIAYTIAYIDESGSRVLIHFESNVNLLYGRDQILRPVANPKYAIEAIHASEIM